MWRSALITWRMQIRRWGMSTPSQRMFSDGRQLRRIPPDFSQSFVFSFRGRSRSVSGAVSGSWRLFTLRQPLLPVQTCCVSYSVCSKFTNLYFFTSDFFICSFSLFCLTNISAVSRRCFGLSADLSAPRKGTCEREAEKREMEGYGKRARERDGAN